eukprot:Nitzschia sp. Nitz4//scaffold24_size164493//152855//154009//NITZ4_002353-RA/size164493-processed-gene-0.248-mRNA-1//-1//CDS//3329544189//510//frame0
MKPRQNFVVFSFVLVALALVHQIHESNVVYAVRMLGITTTSSTKQANTQNDGSSATMEETTTHVIGIRQVDDAPMVTGESLKIPVPHEGCPDLEPMTLQWHRYSENHANNETRTPHQRLLVGLMSGYDDYAQMLDVTGRINMAYAKRFGHDVLLLQGIYLVDSSDKCEPPKRRASFNKIGILQEALRHRDQYDQLLLLDTDAMMYNLSYDVTSLMANSKGRFDSRTPMLVAHRVERDDARTTWNINNGVTLWNLQHPRTKEVVRSWENESKKNFKEVDSSIGDQKTLHTVLKQVEEHVRALREVFAYGHGTIIRHYIRRRTNKGWKDPDVLANRLDLLQEAANEVCANFPEECAAIDGVVDS